MLDTYYTLGGSGLRVSRLSLGTMTFGDRPEGWGTADEGEMRSIFDAYLDAGGNFVDTAEIYTDGRSESLVGQFIAQRAARERVVLATKYSHNMDRASANAGGNHRRNMLRAVEGSLRRLGTDYIDLYIVHAWDRVTPVDEVLRALDDLVRSGKVRYTGVSNLPAWTVAKMQTLAHLRGCEPLCSMQMQYSLLEREIEHEFVPLALEEGIGVTVWSPLASGFLSGKYRPSETGRYGEGRLQLMAGAGGALGGKFTERNWKILAELEAVADECGRSLSQVAINWVANRPGVASVILGATRLAQLEDNLQALDFDLTPAQASRLEVASRPAAAYPYGFMHDIQRRLHRMAIEKKPPHYWG